MFLGMIVYLVLVLIRPQDYPGLADSIALPLLPITLMAAALCWLLSNHKRFDAPQYLLLMGFLVALMLSNIANGWFGGALVQIQHFAPTVLAFLVLANAAYSPERVRVIMGVFTVCAAILALHGIEQASVGTGWTGIGLSQGTRIQYVGIFNDPNDLGLLFVICLPMAFYLGSRGGWMGMRRLFWWLVCAVLLWGIYLTDSRGTILALLTVIGVYAWWRHGLIAAGIAGAVALVAVVMTLPSRMQQLDVSEASAAGRVDSWYTGLQLFKSNPLFGIGAERYSEYYDLTAHNSFVLVLAETGIIGFCIWLAFVGYCFKMMWTAIRQPPHLFEQDWRSGSGGNLERGLPMAEQNLPEQHSDLDSTDEYDYQIGDAAILRSWSEDRAMALTLLLSLCGFFVSAFFLSRSYLVILYLLAALVVAHYTGMRQRNPDLPTFTLHYDLLRWPLYAAGGVLGLYLIVKALLAMSS